MDHIEFYINDEASAQDREFLDEKITEYIYRTTGYSDGILISIAVKQAGEIIDGVSGWTWGGCS
jgi:hypothetical protein